MGHSTLTKMNTMPLLDGEAKGSTSFPSRSKTWIPCGKGFEDDFSPARLSPQFTNKTHNTTATVRAILRMGNLLSARFGPASEKHALEIISMP